RWALDVGRPRFSDTGEFEGYVGSVIDVHERHEAQLKMRAGEERLRLAAESTGFGGYDYDIQGGTGVWTSATYQIFQLPDSEPITWDRFVSMIDPRDVDTVTARFESLQHPDAVPSHSYEYRIVRPDQQLRWLSDSGCVFQTQDVADVAPIRLIGTIQDITERKAFEASLEQAKRMAEAANRSRGEFLANMSHEIRTPMAAILGHADILREHLQNPDNVQLVETIRRNGNFLLNIINDILDLSKIDAGKMEIALQRTRPDAVVAEVRSLMDVRAAEKTLPLNIEFNGPVPEFVHTDPVRLRQILLNLIGNAIKFTDDGEVRMEIRYDSGLLSFDVIDTGIGIKPEATHLLFEPFVQADNTSTRSFGGTGLGLAICKRLAQALGGDVSVESEYGKGSRFTLSINATADGPLVEPNLSETPATQSKSQSVHIKGTILVVDDRRDIRFLAQHFIEKSGGNVVSATNGQEAVDFMFNKESPRVDLIVMDMQMPVMDGYTAVSELRRRGVDIPIIALTANAMKSDRDECLAAGCTDYTTKPIDSQVLLQMIERLLS
ncbi:MAG: response regulator, partial [Pirellulaceae bacterium]|nr:response regulator [Pirellulaceae bacterium]